MKLDLSVTVISDKALIVESIVIFDDAVKLQAPGARVLGKTIFAGAVTKIYDHTFLY